MRDSAIMYRSFYEAICTLPKKERAGVWEAVFEYAFNFKEPDLQCRAKAIFTLIKPQLDANIRRYKNGKIPKQDGSKPEANDKQTVSKREANENDNVNENKNGNENLNQNINQNNNPHVNVYANELTEQIDIYEEDCTVLKKDKIWWRETLTTANCPEEKINFWLAQYWLNLQQNNAKGNLKMFRAGFHKWLNTCIKNYRAELLKGGGVRKGQPDIGEALAAAREVLANAAKEQGLMEED